MPSTGKNKPLLRHSKPVLKILSDTDKAILRDPKYALVLPSLKSVSRANKIANKARRK